MTEPRFKAGDRVIAYSVSPGEIIAIGTYSDGRLYYQVRDDWGTLRSVWERSLVAEPVIDQLGAVLDV